MRISDVSENLFLCGFLQSQNICCFFIKNGQKYDPADQFENGSNMIISVIYKMILDYIKDHKSLPPVLFLNVDNTGRENKVCNIQLGFYTSY